MLHIPFRKRERQLPHLRHGRNSADSKLSRGLAPLVHTNQRNRVANRILLHLKILLSLRRWLLQKHRSWGNSFDIRESLKDNKQKTQTLCAKLQNITYEIGPQKRYTATGIKIEMKGICQNPTGSETSMIRCQETFWRQ